MLANGFTSGLVPPGRRAAVRTHARKVVCALVLTGVACGKRPRIEAESSAQSGSGDIVARVDGHPIFLSELQEVNRPHPTNGSGNAHRGEVEAAVRFEVMAEEAASRGYDKNPEVLRKAKQQMVNKFVQDQFGTRPSQVSESQLEAYYRDHQADFQDRPYADVRLQIQQRMASLERTRQFDEWFKTVRANHNVEILRETW
jgi:hypothetical protein